jgi:hypothetical protein
MPLHIEFEVDHPLLDLRVFRYRAYSVSLIVMAVMMTGLFATLFYVPLCLQTALGWTPRTTGRPPPLALGAAPTYPA